MIPTRPDLPFVALRPDVPGDESPMPILDDVVIDGHISTFRAEMMSDSQLWMALYLDTGEDVHFSVTTGTRAKLKLRCTDPPRTATWGPR